MTEGEVNQGGGMKREEVRTSVRDAYLDKIRVEGGESFGDR